MQFSAYSKEEKNSKHFQLLTSCPLDFPVKDERKNTLPHTTKVFILI